MMTKGRVHALFARPLRADRGFGALRGLFLALALCLPTLTYAEGRAIIVLDASGSMWDELGGRPKVDIAREALNAVLQALPADVELGLLAYGHREKGNCDDIELIVPPAKGRAAAISTAAEFMHFTGKTPLTAAVRAAADALDSTHQQATVVLITDGVDNCSGDPCALASELEDTGTNFTAHVVGFGLKPDEAARVSCLASRTGGSYLQADDLATLTLALQDTVLVPDNGPTPPQPDHAPQPEPVQTLPNFAPEVLLSDTGPVVDVPTALHFTLRALGQINPAPAVYDGVGGVVAPGDYQMETQLGAATISQTITIPPTGTAAPKVILNAGAITLRPRVGPNTGVEGNTLITITDGAGLTLETAGQVDTWLPAGAYTVKAQLDAVTSTSQITVLAGQTVDQDIFISAATVEPQVFYAAGQPVNADGLQIDIVAVQPNADGSRALISSRTARAPVFHLGAGDYIAVTQLGLARAETPFSIALVQRTALPIILDAGVLLVSAPGADLISIGPPPDIGGNAPAGAEFAATAVLETLNAGSFQVTAQFGTQTATAQVVITPGGRAEVALTPP